MKESIYGKNPKRWWLVAFAAVTTMGLLDFGAIVTNYFAEQRPIRLIYPLVDELTGAYTFFILVPPLMWFFTRVPLQRNRLLSHIPLYIFVSALFGMTHTLLMKFSRYLIYPLAGVFDYDYGVMSYRFLMEYQQQIVSFWVCYGIFYFARHLKRSREQQIKAAQLEQALTKARLQALQMQLNPHFLFNTLNMISSTMYENVSDADKMISYLSDLLRLTLNRSNREQYALDEELELLNMYTELMKARFRDKLNIAVHAEAGTEKALVPAFILQPLVENSIKYGMERLERVNIIITVTAKSQGNAKRLRLTVTDNGPGIDGEKSRNGIGLSNTEERLERLYGSDHCFHLENCAEPGKGLCVIIEIPFCSADLPTDQNPETNDD